jgi:Pyruvate/2-oxoacid:ferredoxin oxidoreductase gamma subunit
MKIMICGVGGQGTVLLTHMLCETATREGKRCLSSELHGMSRMLGSVSTTVKIGDYHSPEIDSVDLLVSLDPEETKNNMHLVQGEILTFGEVDGAKTVKCEAPSPNVFVLGILCRKLSLDPKTAKQLIKEFGKRLEDNIKSFEMGYSYEA